MATKQPDLFTPWHDEEGAQGILFDLDGPPLSSLNCGECGEALERTTSGYLACPKGHGKLLAEATFDTEAESGLCFPDE